MQLISSRSKYYHKENSMELATKNLLLYIVGESRKCGTCGCEKLKGGWFTTVLPPGGEQSHSHTYLDPSFIHMHRLKEDALI